MSYKICGTKTPFDYCVVDHIKPIGKVGSISLVDKNTKYKIESNLSDMLY